ncbi:hypothetical protein [Pseudonocardia oroxyli]|uniref:Uncharacterized protein n=1 Tax=Pseudonocardia oroxyli TaxID=366584 RepID=A0A1G8CT18_PSEOR|nr:hypothetical protein [Pseudonocardia oroxyli]SDH48588.1 hypothetical protein SAMN05216377_12347 [Pseudonocardia oroxyli]
MTTQPGPTPSRKPAPTLDEIFANAKAVDSIDELAQDGIFEDDAELDELLADVHRMRRSSVAGRAPDSHKLRSRAPALSQNRDDATSATADGLT